jgi:filamentous hemagglutinin
MSNSNTNTEHKNINMSYDMYGGPSASVSADSSKSSSEQTKYTNSNLQANNININTEDKVNGEAREGTLGWTTTIKGATIAAEDSLTLKSKNLEVASVQDSSKSKSSSLGMSAGFGASGLSSVGANMSNANSNSKQTVLTSLTGNKVDIDTEQETRLRGATIAAVDKVNEGALGYAEGNDNGNLNLKTDTLLASSLNNRVNSKSTSLGINVGFADKAKKDDNNKVIIDKDGNPVTQTGMSSIGGEYSDDRTNSKTKTLATLGNGNVEIGNQEDSDTKMLNTDVANNEVDIYNVSSHKGLKGELDTRLLSEDGRNQIAEDLLKSNMIVNSIKLIATTDRVGVEDFFNETEKTYKTYEAVKEKISKSPELADALNNKDLTPSQKEQMLNEITGAVMVKLGYTENDNVLISTDATGQDNKQIKGFISTETEDSYINDKNNNSNKDLVTTAGHEASSYIDMQEGKDITQNRDDNNIYSDNFGDNLASYTNFALDITGQGSMTNSNNHNSGQVTTTPSVFNDNTIVRNNAEFSGLDKELGDNLIFIAGGQASVGTGVGAADGVGYFSNYKFEDYKFIVEDGSYYSAEAGAGSPTASAGLEFGILFSNDVENDLAGSYINNGGSVGPLGVDISSTSINDKTKQSTTGITINASFGSNIAEGHTRIGKTAVEIQNKQVLIDFSPVVDFFTKTVNSKDK